MDGENEGAAAEAQAGLMPEVPAELAKDWHWVSADGLTWWPAYVGGPPSNAAGWGNDAPWPHYGAELLVGPAIPKPERVQL